MHKIEKSSKQQSLLCCRACLSTDCRLYDIHEYKVDEAFFRITDPPVSRGMLPQHLCAWCLTLLRKCASFRAMCVRTQQRLTEILEWRMDTDSIQRCQPSLRLFQLNRTEVKIIDYVPSENIIYQPDDVLVGDTVKDEPEIEYEMEINNEIKNSFVFKDEIDIKRKRRRYTVNNGNDNDDDGNPLQMGKVKKLEPLDLIIESDELKVDHKDDMEANNDEIEDTKQIFTKNKNHETKLENYIKNIENDNEVLSSVHNYANREKQKRGNVNMNKMTVGVKNNKKNNNKIMTKKDKDKLNSKDADKSNDNKYVSEDKDCARKEKLVKPKRKRGKAKTEYLRHPTDGYMLFDFASFENANGVKIVVVSKEEQLEEMASRKKSRNYLESPFKCEDCGKGYLLEAVYTNHRARQHSPSMMHPCEICGMRFKGNYLRQRHQDVHRLKFMCNGCNFVSRTKHQAKMHHDMHAGKTFECQHCGMSFKKRSSHLSHVRLVHPGHNVVCGECGETFVGDKGLKDHKTRKHPESLKPRKFKCSTCSANFASVEALNRHTDTAGDHADLRPCEQCGENCASEEELHQHVTEKHPTESHHCEECNMTFTNTAAYDTHHRRKHLGKRSTEPYSRHIKRWLKQRYSTKPGPSAVCDQCGYIAVNSSLLVYHMRSHLDVKPFACPLCPKTFAIQAKLNWHMRTHTGEKPYQCSECPHAFSLKGNLNRHIKTVHLKQHDSYPCEICARTFKTRAVLKMHVKTIHEGMPWPKRARRAKDTADNK